MEPQEKARAIVEAIYRGELEERWFKTIILEAVIGISFGLWFDREQLFKLIEQKQRISRELRAERTRKELDEVWGEDREPARRRAKSPQEALPL